MSTLRYGTRRTLLLPMLLSAKNRFFPTGSFPIKSSGVGIFCLVLCTVIFNVTLRVITYFHEQDELGIILSLKIFQMAWILIFAMLIFSCMVSAVSSVYLSQDNEIVFSAPITNPELYFMRYISNTIYQLINLIKMLIGYWIYLILLIGKIISSRAIHMVCVRN